MLNELQRKELQTIFIEHRDRLQATALRIVGKPDVAEDVLQSAYLRISETAGHMVVRQPINYCFQVVRHMAIDVCRRRTLEAAFFVGEVEGQTVSAPHLSPELSAIGSEFLVRIAQTLSELAPRTREAFVLYRIDGMTQRDIAVKLGVSPTLVNFMIKDAVEALKSHRDSADFAG